MFSGRDDPLWLTAVTLIRMVCPDLTGPGLLHTALAAGKSRQALRRWVSNAAHFYECRQDVMQVG
jgi:hypothetical protein